MDNGTVKFFDNHKGYGFLADSEGENDYFFHYKDIVTDNKFKMLDNGQTVTFEVGEYNGREKAFNVTAITE